MFSLSPNSKDQDWRNPHAVWQISYSCLRDIFNKKMKSLSFTAVEFRFHTDRAEVLQQEELLLLPMQGSWTTIYGLCGMQVGDPKT